MILAASNRLRVELDYVDKQGSRGTRLIEPYSMRRTQAGDIVLHALRADGTGHRSYRIDRIVAAPAPFRHSYRSWLDDRGAPVTVQQELMRRASVQTTMNIYGKAMTDSKRLAHSKVVEMVLKPSKTIGLIGQENPNGSLKGVFGPLRIRATD
jgi:predicted DNA-binding transcriptional regulator YafY